MYNRYIPASEDLQNLLMEELMTLKPVGEQDVDTLFSEIERLTEWYIKTDAKGEAMNAKWVRTARIKNLPKSVTQNLAVQLRQAQTVDVVYNLVNIYLHDHSTGLPKGQASAKLYLADAGDKDGESDKVPDKEQTDGRKMTDQWQDPENADVNVVKGDKKGGKGKGYGACWHCGVWGHPRRECLELVGKGKGDVNAFKGKGKGYKGKGKGYKGKGKGNKGGSYYRNNYRSPGKVIGKGLNYYANDEYSEAWGDEWGNYNYTTEAGIQITIMGTWET